MLEDSFPADVAAKLREEIELSCGKCHFDEIRGKIVYDSPADAMSSYMFFQVREMERHKWIESQKAGHDVGDFGLLDWDRRYASTYSDFWKKTHVYVPSEACGRR